MNIVFVNFILSLVAMNNIKPYNLLILLVSFFSISLTCYGKDGPQSEMYIQGFIEYFNSLSAQDQKQFATTVMKYASSLDSVLAKSDYYIEKRDERINSLRNTMVAAEIEEFKRQSELFEEFIQCSFDSAYVTARKCMLIADGQDDIDLKIKAKAMMAQAYVSGGYFKEADRVINDFDISGASLDAKRECLMARFIVEFENGFFFPWRLFDPDESLIAMKHLYDEISPLLPDDSSELYYLKGSMAFHCHDFTAGANYAQILLMKTNPNSWEYINALGNIGYNLIGAGDYAEAMKFMTQSAILAIQRGSNNYSALRKIAELVYVVGATDKASEYINLAMNNATAYNSKYRIIECSKGYPMIIRELMTTNERNRNIIVGIAIVVAFIAVILMVALWYIVRQRKRMKMQAETIHNNNMMLEASNREMIEINNRLKDTHALTSVLAAKMIHGNAQSRALADKLKKDVSMKVKAKLYDGIPNIIDVYRSEINAFYPQLDDVLLSFFPNFVEQFNTLLKPEMRQELEDDGKLNVLMRIFALWRLGVKKNEDIANCMGYSLNTIKSYKTRVLNATNLPKDVFYQKLEEINIVL